MLVLVLFSRFFTFALLFSHFPPFLIITIFATTHGCFFLTLDRGLLRDVYLSKAPLKRPPLFFFCGELKLIFLF